jgi:hypothetical protein
MLARSAAFRLVLGGEVHFLVFPCFRAGKELVDLLVDGWQLDYRSPTVRGMLDVCTEHLLQR